MRRLFTIVQRFFSWKRWRLSPTTRIGLRRSSNWWIAICGIPMILLSIFLWKELDKYSSNFYTVAIYVFFISLFFTLFCYIFFIRLKFKDWWELPFLLTIIGLLISIDNDIVTQSDGNWKNILGRIYNKESKVDLSSEIRQITKPHITIALDMSGSTEIQNNKEYLYKSNKEKLKKEVIEILKRERISDEDIKSFSKGIDKKNEYAMYKLRLFDFVYKIQDKYDITLICFGQYPFISDDWQRGQQLREAFKFIKECEEKNIENKNKTDFVELFKVINKNYSHFCENEQIREGNKNVHIMPKYSIAFFSDYLDDSNHSKKEIEKEITDFFKKPYFSNIYYCKERENYIVRLPSEQGENIFNIFEKNIVVSSTGKLLPIIDDEIELFNISSKQYIPIYYDYAYNIERKSKIRITFDSITVNEVKSTVQLKNNSEKGINAHHQFEINDEILPLEIKLHNNKPITLTFSGRIIEPCPNISLIFFFENSNGYCCFDIVFFKDFPKYVRYIVTFLMLIIVTFAFQKLIEVMRKKELNK